MMSPLMQLAARSQLKIQSEPVHHWPRPSGVCLSAAGVKAVQWWTVKPLPWTKSGRCGKGSSVPKRSMALHYSMQFITLTLVDPAQSVLGQLLR